MWQPPCHEDFGCSWKPEVATSSMIRDVAAAFQLKWRSPRWYDEEPRRGRWGRGLVLVRSLVFWFLGLFVRWFVGLLFCSFVRSFARSLAWWLAWLCVLLCFVVLLCFFDLFVCAFLLKDTLTDGYGYYATVSTVHFGSRSWERWSLDTQAITRHSKRKRLDWALCELINEWLFDTTRLSPWFAYGSRAMALTVRDKGNCERGKWFFTETWRRKRKTAPHQD